MAFDLLTSYPKVYSAKRKEEKASGSAVGSSSAFNWFGKSGTPLDPNLRVLRDELIDLERQLLALKDIGAAIAAKEKELASEYENFNRELNSLGISVL